MSLLSVFGFFNCSPRILVMTTLRPLSKTTKLPSEVLRTNTRKDDLLNLNLVRSDPFGKTHRSRRVKVAAH